MTEQALCDAMRLHGDTVYRLALCRMQNTADAEDVYHQIFLCKRLFQQFLPIASQVKFTLSVHRTK